MKLGGASGQLPTIDRIFHAGGGAPAGLLSGDVALIAILVSGCGIPAVGPACLKVRKTQNAVTRQRNSAELLTAVPLNTYREVNCHRRGFATRSPVSRATKTADLRMLYDWKALFSGQQ